MNGVGVQLRPLLYLTYRSLSNGIRRAFTSGKRLITLLFVVVYYGFMVLRPFGFSGKSSGFSAQNFPIPTADSVGAIAFSAFGLMSVLLMLPLLSTRGGFRQADVDVLFATPVNPKAVMFLIGTEMDYVEEKLKSGFTFRNPNEKGRCGCGESFHV